MIHGIDMDFIVLLKNVYSSSFLSDAMFNNHRAIHKAMIIKYI